MRLVVTGASGFLGHHVLAQLRRVGVQPWTLGRQLPPGQPAKHHVTCDLLRGDEVYQDALRNWSPSHLLHLAWVTDPASYQISPQNDAWIRATQQLTRAFAQAGGRHVVVAGSCAEYGWSHGWCHENTTPLEPATPYGVAKDVTRRWMQDYAKAQGLRLAWARVFFPYGTGQASQRLIPAVVEALRGRRAVFPVQARQRRDFVSAPDVALGLWTLLQASANGCYNISSAEPLLISDLVRMLARVLDADPSPFLALAATELQAPALVAGDNSRLRALGWPGPAPLATGLTRMLGAELN